MDGVAMGGDRAQFGRPALAPLLPAHRLWRSERPRSPRPRLSTIRRTASAEASHRAAMTTGPTWLAHQMVGVAVRTLPASQRERYRQEFNAELHFIPPADQLRYASQVLT